MTDFLVAIGLILAFEGLVFAAFPAVTKRAMNQVLETPDNVLRVVGIAAAVIGVVVIWLIRG
jgi:uncharacterized protein